MFVQRKQIIVPNEINCVPKLQNNYFYITLI